MITVDLKDSNIRKILPSLKIDLPLFAQYTPDFKSIEKLAKKYKSKKNIIVIGNGGSITSSNYFFSALSKKKNFFPVSTNEPDFLAHVRSKCSKKDTVVISISKSGTNVQQLESSMYFFDYPNYIAVTGSTKSSLKAIQERLGFDFIEHPPIGGRYSGFTPCGLLPAAIAGIDIRKIWEGASSGYKKYGPKIKNNLAVKLASVMYELDKKGYNEVFMPIYSSKLLGSKDIITQLIHESVGKNRKGQTLLGVFAPESQHHTNQRFFGGKKNMLGCFVVVDEFDQKYDKIDVPKSIKDLEIRDGKLSDIDNNYYSKALQYEYQGTKEDAKNNKIPTVTVHIKKVTPESIGEYLAFWHYVTVYNCVLNGVDPFDQPQVEAAKNISFKLRKNK